MYVPSSSVLRPAAHWGHEDHHPCPPRSTRCPRLHETLTNVRWTRSVPPMVSHPVPQTMGWMLSAWPESRPGDSLAQGQVVSKRQTWDVNPGTDSSAYCYACRKRHRLGGTDTQPKVLPLSAHSLPWTSRQHVCHQVRLASPTSHLSSWHHTFHRGSQTDP